MTSVTDIVETGAIALVCVSSNGETVVHHRHGENR